MDFYGLILHLFNILYLSLFKRFLIIKLKFSILYYSILDIKKKQYELLLFHKLLLLFKYLLLYNLNMYYFTLVISVEVESDIFTNVALSSLSFESTNKKGIYSDLSKVSLLSAPSD